MAGETDVSVIIRLVDQLSGVARQVNASLQSIQDKAKGVGFAMQRQGEIMSKLGPALMADSRMWLLGVTTPFAVMLKTASDYETTLNNLRSTFHGSVEDFNAAKQAIVAFSNQMPFSKTAITDVYTAMNQFNVAISEQSATFKTISDTALAMNADLGQTANFLLSMKTQLNLTTDQTKLLGDQLNWLSENAGSSVEGIQLITQHLGGMASEISGSRGVTALQAFAGAMAAMGMQTRSVETGLRELFSNIAAPSDKFVAALDTIKVSVDGLRTSMANDPGGSYIELLERINALPDPSDKLKTLNELFGPRAGAAIMPLLKNLQDLQDKYDALSDSQKLAANTQDDVNNGLATAGAKTQMFWNAINNLKDQLAGPWLERLTNWADSLRVWVVEVQKAEGPVRLLGEALGILAGVGPVLFGLGLTLKVLGPIWTIFGAALSAPGPLLAITALAGAIYILYQRWDEVKPAWEGMTKAAGELAGAFGPLATALKELTGIDLSEFTLSDVVKGFSDAVVVGAVATLKTLTETLQGLKALLTGDWGTAFKKLGALADVLKLIMPGGGYGAIAGMTGGGGATPEVPEGEQKKALENWLNRPKTQMFKGLGPLISKAQAAEGIGGLPYTPMLGNLPSFESLPKLGPGAGITAPGINVPGPRMPVLGGAPLANMGFGPTQMGGGALGSMFTSPGINVPGPRMPVLGGGAPMGNMGFGPTQMGGGPSALGGGSMFYSALKDTIDELMNVTPAKAAANAPVGGSPPAGITIQAQGPSVVVRQAPPNINIAVSVNVLNPDEAPSATAAAVGQALGDTASLMSDGASQH